MFSWQKSLTRRPAPPIRIGTAGSEHRSLFSSPRHPSGGRPLHSAPELPLAQTLREGARFALEESLAGEAPTVEVTATAQTRLADYPAGARCPTDDALASVVLAVRGERAATAILSFAPKEALALIRCLGAGDVPGRPSEALSLYRRGAGWMAAGMLAALAGRALPLSEPELTEDAMVATLTATHAPPDTSVLSAHVAIEGVGIGTFTLLMDPKGLDRLVDGLGESAP